MVPDAEENIHSGVDIEFLFGQSEENDHDHDDDDEDEENEEDEQAESTNARAGRPIYSM